jgi:hypothetical protein
MLSTRVWYALQVVCTLMHADDDNDAVLFEKIKKGNYDADDPIWDNISADAKVRNPVATL